MLKREIFAAALFAALIFGSAWNLKTMNETTSAIEISLCKSRMAAEELDFKASKEHCKDAMELWLENEKYKYVFFPNDRISDTSEAFFQLWQILCEEDATACAAVYENLRYRLREFKNMETPSLGSIF